MRPILSLASLVIASLLLSCITAQAEATAAPLDGKSAGAAAETFLAGYLKAGARNSEWVARTKFATPEFKAAFKKAMADKELGSDPVLFAQDVPTTPFKAESSQVKGDTAIVVLAAKYDKETSKLKVTLVAKDGHWLVSRTAQAK
jgi:hypothetical protein